MSKGTEQSVFDAIYETNPEAAATAKRFSDKLGEAEKTIKQLKEENERMKDELLYAANSLEAVGNYYVGKTVLRNGQDLLEFTNRRAAAAIKAAKEAKE